MPDQQSWVDALRSGGANFGTMSPQEQAPAGTVDTIVNLLKGAYGGVEDTAKGAIESAGNYAKTGEYDPKPVVDAALMAAGGATPFAEKGAAGIFGGVLSQTADKNALTEARLMHSMGHDNHVVFQKTGWYKDPATQTWRNEIPDHFSYLEKPNSGQELINEGPMPMGDLLNHRHLYDAYSDTALINTRRELSGNWGMYMPPLEGISPKLSKEWIGLAGHLPDADLKTTALHELQHAVHHREGLFTEEGGSSRFYPKHYNDFRKAVDERKASIEPVLNALNINPKDAIRGALDQHAGVITPMDAAQAVSRIKQHGDIDEFTRFAKAVDLKNNIERSAHAKYMNQPGEMDARNVETRMNMSRDQRRANPPWTTQDVPLAFGTTTDDNHINAMIRSLLGDFQK